MYENVMPNPEAVLFDAARARDILLEWTNIDPGAVELLDTLVAHLANCVLPDGRIPEMLNFCDDEDEGSWAMGRGRGGAPSTVDIREIMERAPYTFVDTTETE